MTGFLAIGPIHGCKISKFLIILLFFALYIDDGYSLEPPQYGGSNEYQHSDSSKIRKIMYTIA